MLERGMKKWLISVLLVLLISSCSTVKYVPQVVERVKTEYIAKTDTTIVRDSIFVSEKVKSDTVYLTKEKYKYIYKVKTDTLQVRDTIPVIKEVQVDVPYVPERYKKIERYFWILITGLLGFIIYKITKFKIG